ncbi:MAG TPA: hypothetical protein DHW02_14765, partial [Ktedonobacter sp.]|nr:hypothetical protein [Ktedonobacter sp.]
MNEHDDLPKISGYVSVKEAANMLNISDKMVYFYIENKRLSAVRAADVILIPVQEIEAFERKGVGRSRVNTPKWRISTKDNVLSSTAIYV